MINKVICRDNRWAISIGKQDEIIVSAFNYPIELPSISLFDGSYEEFRKIGEMFLEHAEELEERVKRGIK